MARMPRLKLPDRESWYHISAYVAEYVGKYPLAQKGAREKLLEIIRHYVEVYFCCLAGYCILGNHYHSILKFEKERSVPREELKRRAYILYPSRQDRARVDRWTDEEWERFRTRLFDVSELMRNIQTQFAKWFNATFERSGHFWGERFHSVCLESGRAVLDCMLYVDLNPVRAGLVQRPQDWRWSSIRARLDGQGAEFGLMPMSRLLPWLDEERALSDYRIRLLYRGASPGSRSRARIPKHILDQELRRGYEPGAYLVKRGHFSRGVALGGKDWIESIISQAMGNKEGESARQPTLQSGGDYSLRAQRTALPRPDG